MRCAALLLALLAFAAPAAAQQFPSQQRGLAADTAYQSGDIDSVNLFNGNLSLAIPLGQPYPVGPAFSLGFTLHYNSKVWDYEEKLCNQTFPTQIVPYHLPIPDRLANTGVGWLLTPGRLLDPSTFPGENPLNDGPNWVYVSSDGGHHALYPRLHPGYPATVSSAGTLYSNDGTYLRHKKLAGSGCRTPSGVTGDCRIVEFPDGSRHEFRAYRPFDWRVVRMEDSFGNRVDVDYQLTGSGADHKWTFSDPHGRSQVVDFENGRIRWVRLTAFGETTATWEFQYQTATIPRHGYTQLSCSPAAPAVNTPVTFLTRIVRPDQSYFEFDYNRNDHVTLSGAVKYLRYPTGGSLEWTYQTYGFPKDDGSLDSPSAKSSGVATKTLKLASGATVGTWSYDVTALGNPMGPGQSKSPCFHTMRVTDPLGQDTEHFFSSIYNNHFWAYGLPYTYCDPDTGAYDDTSGAFLSKRIWSGTAGSSSLLRSYYVEYDTDGPLAPDDQNRNHRQRYQMTIFEDDGDRVLETIHSDFDGLGNWRQTVVQGSFGPSKTSVTQYRPGGGTLLLGDDTSLPQTGNSFSMPGEGDRWLFGLSPRSSVRQGSGAEIVTETCFEDSTGFLLRSRQLAGAVPQAFDLLTLNTRNGNGFLTSQRHYGGDGASLPTAYGSLCSMSEPVGDPQFRIDHGWTAASLASSKWIDSCDQSIVLQVVDATIDQRTGLPSAVRDPAGLETTYQYDALGRTILELPEEGASTNTVFKIPTVGNPNIERSVEVTTCATGEASCSGTARGSSRYKAFDSIGRLDREALALPVEGDPQQSQDRKFTYNALGWKLSESTWRQQKQTTFSGYDRFGRVGWIQPPGTNQGIGVSYYGDRRTVRRSKVETETGLVDNWVTEDRDHFGRLVAVCEAQSSQPGAETGCGDLLTTYSYDALDRLTGVCARPNGSACGQTRAFTYDGRGFLLAEKHPELGAAGNATASYRYDALGHVTHSQIDGSADFELQNKYDSAGRLIRVEQKAGAIWKPLKEFFYARESDGIDRKGGKLVLAKRHNWVDPLAPGDEALGSIDAIVTDEYRYEGFGGRTSHKTTSFRLGGSTNAFESQFRYDDFGNLATIVYPEPLAWPLARFRQPREVDYGYTLGFLTSVPGFAPQISYQLGGMLHQIDYQSGASWTQSFNTADHLPRPFNITVAGVTSGWSSGNTFYDGYGNVSQIGSLQYRYDRLSRLVRGQTHNGAGVVTQTAAYDDFGNLTTLTTAGVAQALPTQEGTNHLTSGTYDSAGNLTQLPLGEGTWKYNFDGLRKLSALRSNSNQARLFFYDASDERLFAWDCPQSSCNPDHDFERWTLRGLGGEVLRSFAGAGKFTTTWEEDFVYGPGSLVATIKPSAMVPGEEDRRYVAVDHLGSTRLIWNEQNQTQDRYDFHPFGQEVAAFSVGDPPHKFTGHERDQNGGGKGLLDYMRARYASPFTGRFLSVDPVLGRPAQPQSWNRYAYALNNPVKYTDPNGETANDIAVAGQNKIAELKHDVVEFGFDVLPSEGAVVFGTVTGTIGDIASALLDPLRFGDAVGTAVGSDASAGEITLAVLQDADRGGALVGGATGLITKGVKTLGQNATIGFLEHAARGRASEARVLSELGLTKNTQAVSTIEGKSYPDALTEFASIEIKDSARVSRTRQVRIQTDAAKAAGRRSILITGERTCISASCARSFDRIIRRSDLGPQQ